MLIYKLCVFQRKKVRREGFEPPNPLRDWIAHTNLSSAFASLLNNLSPARLTRLRYLLTNNVNNTYSIKPPFPLKTLLYYFSKYCFFFGRTKIKKYITKIKSITLKTKNEKLIDVLSAK